MSAMTLGDTSMKVKGIAMQLATWGGEYVNGRYYASGTLQLDKKLEGITQLVWSLFLRAMNSLRWHF